MFKVGDKVRIKSTAGLDVTGRYDMYQIHTITKTEPTFNNASNRYYLNSIMNFWVFGNEIELAKHTNRRKYA